MTEIIFEVIPYVKTVSETYANKFADRIADVVKEAPVSMINIPEIVEENHIGLPYYRNADNMQFGLKLKEKCQKEVMLNTVVVHHESKDIFEKWLDESISCGIRNYVFVGAKINSMKYPGPSVIEANSIAKSKKINFGNIFIPERANEVERLINKTISGCRFFTSQVLYEPENAINVINKYWLRCSQINLKPSKFYLSFAPVSNIDDLTFLKWLGAEIKEETERRLLSAQNIANESVKIASEASSKIFGFFEKTKFRIQLGLNVEYITLHNLDITKILLQNLANLKLAADFPAQVKIIT